MEVDKDEVNHLMEYQSFLIGTFASSIETACGKGEVDNNQLIDILSNAQMIKMLAETNVELSTRI